MEIDFSKLKKYEKLGEGTYGIVYRAVYLPNNTNYALKKIKTQNFENGLPQSTLREICLLSSINHENIIKLVSYYYCPKIPRLCLLFEYEELDLANYLLNYCPPDYVVRSLAIQLLIAVAYLHNNNIIHRDIKPGNILINPNNGKLKLGDFGLARVLIENSDLSRNIQTLWYRCPEVILGDFSYGEGVDLWAIGCVLYEIKYKKILFSETNEIGQLFKIFQAFGSPLKSGYYSSLEYYKEQVFPHWAKKDFPNNSDIIDIAINNLLKIEPNERVRCVDLLNNVFKIEV